MDEKENWFAYLVPMENVEIPQENPLEVVKAIEVVTPISSYKEVIGKRNFSYAMEKEEEEGSSETTKRKKVEAEG